MMKQSLAGIAIEPGRAGNTQNRQEHQDGGNRETPPQPAHIIQIGLASANIDNADTQEQSRFE